MSSYIFIDGGYLRRQHADAVKEWFGSEPDINFPSVIGRLKELSGLSLAQFITVDRFTAPEQPPESRSFYYDCFDEERRTGESESEFETRLDRENARLQNIREVEGCHIRLGALKGAKKRTQKEVDVLIAVDMMAHAARRNMAKAVLVTGDQDLRPAVEALVQMGVFVHLIGVEKHVSKELTWAASTYTKLTFEDFYQCTSPSLQAKHPKPRTTNYEPRFTERKAVKEGSLNGNKCTLFQSASGYDVYFQKFELVLAGYPSKSELDFQHENLDRLELYLTLNYGSIVWDA